MHTMLYNAKKKASELLHLEKAVRRPQVSVYRANENVFEDKCHKRRSSDIKLQTCPCFVQIGYSMFLCSNKKQETLTSTDARWN